MKPRKFTIGQEIAPKRDANWLSPTSTPAPRDGVYKVTSYEWGGDLIKKYPQFGIDKNTWYISTTESPSNIMSSEYNWEKVVPTSEIVKLFNEETIKQ